MENTNEPRPQIVKMISPEDDKAFLESLPESTVNESASDFTLTSPDERPINPLTGKPRRANFGKKLGPRKPRTEASSEPVDPNLERAKRKYASLGGGRAVKKFFDLVDKPLDAGEIEDVDDYFLLLSYKAKLDPSESWIMMVFCFIILVGALASARLSWADDVKRFFSHDEEPTELPEANEI